MTITWIFLIFLIFLLLAGLAIIMFLVRQPKSRGPILGGIALLMLVFAFLFSMRVSRTRVIQEATLHQYAINGSRQMGRESSGDVMVQSVLPPKTGGSAKASPGDEEPSSGARQNTPGDRAAFFGPRDPMRRTRSLDYVTLSTDHVTLPDDRQRWLDIRDKLNFETISENRPWVENAAGSQFEQRIIEGTRFTYWLPNTKNQLVGYADIEATEAAAREAAYESFVSKLATLALIELKRKRSKMDAVATFPLAIRLATETDARHYEDIYSERGFSRRSGSSVFRSAALFQLESDTVTQLSSAIETELETGWLETQRQYRIGVWTVLSALSAAFIVFIVYCFMNAGTKGHFVWPLRIVSLCIILFIATVVYMVRVKMGLG